MNKNARKNRNPRRCPHYFYYPGFVILVSIFPPGKFLTTDQFIQGYSRALLYPVIPAFLLVLVNIPFFVSLHFFADEPVRPFALAGLLFGVAYAVSSGFNYFLQLTVVPQNMETGQSLLVTLTSMHIKGSPALALDNLGYTFLSASFLFFSGIFSLRGIKGIIKTAFIVYGITGLMGTTGYMTGNAFLESFVLISSFPYLVAVVLVLVLYSRMSES